MTEISEQPAPFTEFENFFMRCDDLQQRIYRHIEAKLDASERLLLESLFQAADWWNYEAEAKASLMLANAEQRVQDALRAVGPDQSALIDELRQSVQDHRDAVDNLKAQHKADIQALKQAQADNMGEVVIDMEAKIDHLAQAVASPTAGLWISRELVEAIETPATHRTADQIELIWGCDPWERTPDDCAEPSSREAKTAAVKRVFAPNPMETCIEVTKRYTGTTHENILALIAEGITTQQEMAKKLGLSQGRISAVCGDLVHKNSIVRHPPENGQSSNWYSIARTATNGNKRSRVLAAIEHNPIPNGSEMVDGRCLTAAPIAMEAKEADRFVAFMRCAAAGGSIDDCEASTGFTPKEIYELLQRFEVEINLIAGFKSPTTVQAYLDTQRKDLMELGRLKREKPATMKPKTTTEGR